MGTYYIPRNVKGEGRILIIFSVKALLYTGIGALIGVIFYMIFMQIGKPFIGIIFVGIFGLIGFLLGTLKVPETTAFVFTQKNGGENLDAVILKWIKFKKNKAKLYTLVEEEKNG